MELGLYQITLKKGADVVYKDNLPFNRVEPNNEDIIALFKLLRPAMEFDHDKIEWKFLRPSLPKEL